MKRALLLAFGLVFFGDAQASDTPHDNSLIFHQDPDVVLNQILQAVNKAYPEHIATGVLVVDFAEMEEGYCGLYRPIYESGTGDGFLGPISAVSLASEDGSWGQHVLNLGDNAIRPHGFCPPVEALTSELEQRLRSALAGHDLLSEAGGTGLLVQFDAYRLREMIYAQSSDEAVYRYQLSGACGLIWGNYHAQYDQTHARWLSVEVMPPDSFDLDRDCLASLGRD